MTPLNMAMVVSGLFMIVKWEMKATHKSDQESMLLSGKDLYQVRAYSNKVSGKILQFTSSLAW